MAMVVKNNMSAVRTLNTLNTNSSALQKSLAKVSSGMKINSAQDDASGYAISERMRVQIRSLDQANQNTQNASSLMKTAEGAVSSTVEILKSLKEKAINAATDTNTDSDRATIQKELDQFIDQIDDNALTTFNGKYLVDGSKSTKGANTFSKFTNQSLSTDNNGSSKLTELQNRNGESLEIKDTDYVTASYVKDGKTTTVNYRVDDTDLAEIFKQLDAAGGGGIFAGASAASGSGGNTSTPIGQSQLTEADLKTVATAQAATDITGLTNTTGTKALATAYFTNTTGGTVADNPAATVSHTSDADNAIDNLVNGASNTLDADRDKLIEELDDQEAALVKTVYDAIQGLTLKNGGGTEMALNVVADSISGANKSVTLTYKDATGADATTNVATANNTAGVDANILTAAKAIVATAKTSLDNYIAGSSGNGATSLAEAVDNVVGSISASADSFTNSGAGTATVTTTNASDFGTAYLEVKSAANWATLDATGMQETAFPTASGTGTTQTTVVSEPSDDTAQSTVVQDSILIGKNAAGDPVNTADGTKGLTISSANPGVKDQISGVTISISDSEGNVKKAANAALDAFKATIYAKNKSADNSLSFQVGASANQSITVGLDDMRSEALGLKGADGSKVSVATQDKANAAVAVFDNAIQKVLDQQATIGAIESRLEYTSQNLTTSSENVQAAESTIRDADMAKEMTTYTKNNVLLQAAQSMLAQANQNSSAVLSLLQ